MRTETYPVHDIELPAEQENHGMYVIAMPPVPADKRLPTNILKTIMVSGGAALAVYGVVLGCAYSKAAERSAPERPTWHAVQKVLNNG